MAVRLLVLSEDSGKQAQPTIQALTRAGVALVVPNFDSRRLEMRPPPEDDLLIRALHANAWKTKKPTPEKIRLLGEIANSLLDGFVVFHVDTDTPWTKRAKSENRNQFETIIRKGVSLVLQGFTPNPIGKKAPSITEAVANQLLKRLFVMQPCYSVESWLYQSQAVVEFCAARHSDPNHLKQIAAWHADRRLLDEVNRPKDDALGSCVSDHHNAALASAFPSAEVHAAQRSWTEFVEQLAANPDLLARLSTAA